MATWNELRKPKFSDKEIAACKWIEECQIRGWTVDLLTKRVRHHAKFKPEDFTSFVEFAEHFGWNPDCK